MRACQGSALPGPHVLVVEPLSKLEISWGNLVVWLGIDGVSTLSLILQNVVMLTPIVACKFQYIKPIPLLCLSRTAQRFAHIMWRSFDRDISSAPISISPFNRVWILFFARQVNSAEANLPLNVYEHLRHQFQRLRL